MLRRRLLDVADLCAGRQVEFLRIEREQFEMIMMRAMTLGRAGSAITRLAEIIFGLAVRRCACRQFASRRRDIEGSPVTEQAVGRVGVVDYQCEALGARGRLRP